MDPGLELISIANRAQGLRQLGLNPNDLPAPVAQALDSVLSYLNLAGQA